MRPIFIDGPVAEIIPLQLRPRKRAQSPAVQPDRQRILAVVILALDRREVDVVVAAVPAVVKLVVEFAVAGGERESKGRI